MTVLLGLLPRAVDQTSPEASWWVLVPGLVLGTLATVVCLLLTRKGPR